MHAFRTFSAAVVMLISCIASPSFGQPATSPWPMFGHDAQHTGQSAYAGALDCIVSWSFIGTGPFGSSPAVGSDGACYVGYNGADYNYLFVFNSSGSLKWTYELGGAVAASPVLTAGDRVLFGSSDNQLYCLSSSAILEWSYDMNSGSGPAVAADGSIYALPADNWICALDAGGLFLWSYRAGGSFYKAPPAIGADGVLYAGGADKRLYAIDPSGGLRWSFAAAGDLAESPSVGADGKVCIGSWDSRLYCIASTGSFLWSYYGDGLFSTVAIDAAGRIYAGTFFSAGNMFVLDSQGAMAWSYLIGETEFSSPVIGSDGTCYIGTDVWWRRLYALTPGGLLLWSYYGGPDYFPGDYGAYGFKHPAIGSDGRVCVGSMNAVFYLFDWMPTAIPTATPTWDPSLPTPTVTPTPMATGTPTITPTQVNTATPTPTPFSGKFYYASNQWRINNSASLFALKPRNSTQGWYRNAWHGGSADPGEWWTNVYVRSAGGGTRQLGDMVGYYARTEYPFVGRVTAEWNCPEIDIEPGDALQLEEVVRCGTHSYSVTFISEPLGADKILPGTWAFARYVDFSFEYARAGWGNGALASWVDGIECHFASSSINFQSSAAPTPAGFKNDCGESGDNRGVQFYGWTP